MEGLDDDALEAALAAAERPRYACFPFSPPLVALWDYHVTPQSLIRLLGDQSRRARPVVKHLYRRAGDVPDAFADYLYNINALPGSSERVLTTLFKPADRDDALRGIYARRALVDDPRAPSLPPTTVLYGERDWMLNGLTERAVADLGAELVLVPDAGHQIHLENPEECTPTRGRSFRPHSFLVPLRECPWKKLLTVTKRLDIRFLAMQVLFCQRIPALILAGRPRSVQT